MVHLIKSVVAVLIIISVVTAAGEYTDSEMGYTVILPENWKMERVSATHHFFSDTTDTYQSQISIVQHDFSADTLISVTDDWTRAHFIAYQLTMEADPLSALIFTDTVTIKQNNVLWAADAYAYIYSYDTMVIDYAEYVRYTATGSTGYELYAIGSIEDMDLNCGYYAAIIGSITLKVETTEAVKLRRVVRPVAKVQSFSTGRMHDLLGRTLVTSSYRPTPKVAAGYKGHRLLLR